uniref:Uncharacterized protein n=1 Tax=Dendroctonus ponderosae TaxID=77166 RepID=A0AAR5QHJ7_DENPD
MSLPNDSRLLETPRKIELKHIEPGKYFHIGIKHGLDVLLSHALHNESLLKNNKVEVLVNVDGLPISDSSSSQLYPILLALFPHNGCITLVGLYHGYEKPKAANEF